MKKLLTIFAFFVGLSLGAVENPKDYTGHRLKLHDAFWHEKPTCKPLLQGMNFNFNGKPKSLYPQQGGAQKNPKVKKTGQ